MGKERVPGKVDARLLSRELRKLGDRRRAAILQRFFKTGEGEYGAGDVFRGVRVPEVRKLAPRGLGLTLAELQKLLRSEVHEERLLALVILVQRYRREDERGKERLYRFYLRNLKWVSNWDLVDVSAEHIIGAHLAERERSCLTELARSPSLWKRRISIMATFHFIRRGEYGETLRIAALLLRDREDLIHKAVGWMLREVGKRERSVEEAFLREHYREMPRTMLRYAIEKFPASLRRRYLRGAV